MRPMSSDARAQVVADAIGLVSDGGCRKRVFAAAKQQIENAVAMDRAASKGGGG